MTDSTDQTKYQIHTPLCIFSNGFYDECISKGLFKNHKEANLFFEKHEKEIMEGVRFTLELLNRR
jgi:hypothetical protein